MSLGITTPSQVLSAVGPGAPIALSWTMFAGGVTAPAILCIVSSGASLTYSVEVTGDDILAPGYSPSTGNWVGFTGLTALTASAVGSLGAVVTAIRPHITAYTSGTLTFQMPQVVPS